MANVFDNGALNVWTNGADNVFTNGADNVFGALAGGGGSVVDDEPTVIIDIQVAKLGSIRLQCVKLSAISAT
jgi:hypothetical protein